MPTTSSIDAGWRSKSIGAPHVESGADDAAPPRPHLKNASSAQKKLDGAKYSDFFNKIDPEQTSGAIIVKLISPDRTWARVGAMGPHAGRPADRSDVPQNHRPELPTAGGGSGGRAEAFSIASSKESAANGLVR